MIKPKEYIKHCPECKVGLYFDLNVSKGYYCPIYKIVIHYREDGDAGIVSYAGPSTDERRDCSIIKRIQLNKKLKKCQFGV